MDCRTAQRILDCLQDNQTSPGEEQLRRQLADHLEQCADCSHLSEEWRHFDRQLYSMLHSANVPADLEQRLLDSLDQELPVLPAPASTKYPPKPGQNRRVWPTTIMAVLLLVCVGGGWTWYRHDELTNFSGAGRQLASCFLKDQVQWKDLERFDNSFDLETAQHDLEPFMLSPPHGIDLGGGRGQDAAVFKFGLKNWGGIITVLPSQHLTGVADSHDPRVPVARSVLQWRSSDGRFTYICFVHQGSALELARELFGLLT